MDLLVTYDVDTTTPEGQRRLTRVARVCEGFGERVQFSVFECRLDAVRFARLLTRLEAVMEPELDSINLYRFAGSISDARISLGRRGWHQLGEPWIF